MSTNLEDEIQAALQRIGFNAPSSREIVVNQGMDQLEEFKLLSDDEVSNLCKVIRRPGGTVGSGTRRMPNPGIQISLKAEKQFKDDGLFY